MPTSAPATDLDARRREVLAWFHDHYLPRWIANGSGRRREPPTFILDYWHVPLLVTTAGGATWLADQAAVTDYLDLSMDALKASHYDHSVVLDQQVRVYHARGAALDILWSRRRADGAETQRTAMHYELARIGPGSDGWRVVGMQVAETTGTSIPW